MAKKKNNDLDLEEYKENDGIVDDSDDIVKKVLNENEEQIINDYFKDNIKDDFYEEENPDKNFVDDYLKENFKEENNDNESEKTDEENDYDDYEIEESSTGDDVREEVTVPKVKKFYIITIIIVLLLVLGFVFIKFVINNKSEEEVIKDKKLIEELSNKVDILSTKKYNSKSDYYINNLYSNKEVNGIENDVKDLLILSNIKYKEETLTEEIKLALKKSGYESKTIEDNDTTTCNRTIGSCNKVNISDEVDFSKEYKKLFNESKKPNNKIEDDCRIYYYLEETKQFVMDDLCSISARSSLTEDLYYKDEFTLKKDEAYVYVQKGLKYCFETKDETTCGVNNGLSDGEKDIMSITPEEYKSFKITEKNKDKFKTFKFVFKKGKDNNYYFVSQKRVR